MGFIEWVQRRLIEHGFDPGRPDNIWGRKTLGAAVAFQKARGLPASGTLNAATVAALRLAPTATIAPSGTAGTPAPGPEAPEPEIHEQFPWMALGLRKKGMHERDDNRDLRAFLKSDGKTLGDPAQLPWCGDFVETCIAVTLPEAVLPGNPYLARNWLKFGATVDPCYGSVLVFWRGSRSGTQGHVAFYYAEDGDAFHVLGGNQSNTISVTRIARDRLLGARLPLVGGPYPRKRVAVAANGAVSTNEF